MNRKKLIAGVAVAILVLGVGSAGIAYATGGDAGQTTDNDAAEQAAGDTGHKATGPGIEKAKSIALDHISGGRVTGTEVQDEEGYYEVEVTRDDGTQVDVHLDKNFNLLVSKADHEDANGHDGPDGQDGPNDD
ncbi:hypothetical protein BH18ACT10_BH18ACT10_00230 [soil metagenome]